LIIIISIIIYRSSSKPFLYVTYCWDYTCVCMCISPVLFQFK